MSVVAVTTRLEAVLGSYATTEARLAVSAAIVIGGMLGIGVVIPRGWLRVQQACTRWLDGRFDGRVTTAIERVDGVVSLSTVSTLVVRGVQLAVLLVGFLAVLVVWGRLGIAWRLLGITETILPSLGQLLLTAGVGITVMVANDLLSDVVGRYTADSAHISAHQEQILMRVLQVAIILAALVAVFSIWGIDIGSLLVGAGFLGIVIGLAARQTLGSLLAGFVLMFSRPFEIGDWVAIGDAEGIVTKITIMNTIMRNFDGEHIIIPNDNVANRTITNRSRDGKLRIHVEVGIDYDDDPEHAKAVAREAVTAVDMVENNPKPQVFPVAFGGSAVTLDIRFWIAPPTPQRRWHATAGVVEAVKQRFATESISIPFPQRTVGSRDVDDETAVKQTSEETEAAVTQKGE
jgi:small-conductance mechanosensitive channel